MTVSATSIEPLVRTATGPVGLLVVFLYSFLVAFALPFPGEVVLAAPLDLGLSYPATLAVIVVVSSAGKALGSLLALRVGRGVTESGVVSQATGALPKPPGAGRMLAVVERYGYYGLAAVLSVPLLPDTASVYAFSVLEADHRKFAAAAFAGSAGRLVVTATVVGSVLTLL